MKQELKIGWWVLGGALVAALVAVAVFSAGAAGRLNYTIVFEDGKGLQVGDRVQLSGVDIGVVRGVELVVPPGRIDVAVRIDAKHAEKVRADSTAVIRNVSIPNVSGQMIIEVFNSGTTPPAAPMQDGATIKGQEGMLGVKAWQLRNKIGAASGEMGVMVGEARQSLEDFSDEVGRLARSPELQQAISELRGFVEKMSQQGSEAAQQLRAEWPGLKAKIEPIINQIKDLGSNKIPAEMDRMMKQIERTLDSWNTTEPTPEATPELP